MSAPIPAEVAVRFEVNSLLDALSRGDFAAAAESQAKLRELGWYFSREAPKSQRNRLNARQAARHEGGDHVA